MMALQQVNRLETNIKWNICDSRLHIVLCPFCTMELNSRVEKKLPIEAHKVAFSNSNTSPAQRNVTFILHWNLFD